MRGPDAKQMLWSPLGSVRSLSAKSQACSVASLSSLPSTLEALCVPECCSKTGSHENWGRLACLISIGLALRGLLLQEKGFLVL